MADPANHWKLGLFVVASLALAGAVIVGLGAQTFTRERVSYATYFDESVQGLEVGAPVKFRGVTIGNVSKITVAPDHRHVAVTSDLLVEDIVGMGLASPHPSGARFDAPPDLRVQLAAQGLTGVKFLQVDFFPADANPLPVLTFDPPVNYIPAARSVLKNLEDAVVTAVGRVPEVADEALIILHRVDGFLADVESRRLPERTVATIDRANAVLAQLESTLAGLDTRRLSMETQKTLIEAQSTLRDLDALVQRAGADEGLYGDVSRTTVALGDAARNSSGAARDLGATLRAARDAMTSIQRLTDALERDPDMLLKGRARRTDR